MQTMMKHRKAIAFVLMLAMLFSIVPTAVWAETDGNDTETTTAYVTIANKGNLVVTHEAIEISDVNKNGYTDIDDALYAAHKAKYPGGATAGYATANSQWGLSLAKLWGDESYNFGYWVNNGSAWGLTDSVTNGDHVVAFVNQHAWTQDEPWSDTYSYFNTDAITTTASSLSLTLYKAGYDENWNSVFEPAKNAAILINGNETTYKTNEDGNVTLSFVSDGEYTVSATSSALTLVPPVCIVNVNSHLIDDEVLEIAVNALGDSIILQAGENLAEAAQKLVGKHVTGVTVSLKEASNVIKDGKAVRNSKDLTGTATVSLTSGETSTAVTLAVTVKADPALVEETNKDIATLMENIAAGYADGTTVWDAVTYMGAYEDTHTDTAHKLTAEAKQNYINTQIKAVTNGGGETTYSTAILSLTALGVDAKQLYPVNSNTSVDAFAKLKALTHSSSVWSVPYTIASYENNGKTIPSELLNQILTEQKTDGFWNEYDMPVDSTGNILLGLAFYNDAEHSTVQTAVDNAVNYLSKNWKADKTFGNANTTAAAIMGLAANGINPHTDARFIASDGTSLLDSLLTYAVGDKGFGYSDSSEVNEYASRQAFGALIAASQVMNTGKAFNIYDFSGNTLTPGRATGIGEVSKPSTPSGSSNVTVTVSIKGLDGYWLKEKAVTLKDDATMYWALVDAIDGSDITQTGAENGYVSEMSNGKTKLKEFDYGRNSGWLYKVNNTLPEVGLLQYTVKNGDKIEWYYTKDWTTDSLAGGRVNDTDKKAAASVDELLDKLLKDLGSLDNLTADDAEAVAQIRKAYDALTDEQKALVKGYDDLVAAEALLGETEELPFADIENHWAGNSIRFVYENGLMRGVSDTDFAPDATFSRAMLVAVLHRMAGEPAANGAYPFADVRDTAWYANPVAWAYQNKLAGGMTETQYAPNAPITREQLAVMLMRFAQYMDYDTADTIRLVHYKDAGSVSGYAEGAVKWAVANGILKGRNLNELAPQGTATRAEVAVMLERFVNLYTSDKQA